jgi:hypothetical protein
MSMLSPLGAIVVGLMALLPMHAVPVVTVPEAFEAGAPSGHYLDGRTDQVFYYDGSTGVLTPAVGVDPQGLYDVDIVGKGQTPSIMTQQIDMCPTTKNYCAAMGWALVGGNEVKFIQTVMDRCASQPFTTEFTHHSTTPVMRFTGVFSSTGGCCGTVFAELFIQGRVRDDDSMFWRSGFGCP